MYLFLLVLDKMMRIVSLIVLVTQLNAVTCQTYDFIIVGGGTAGAVLANRLSEVKRWNVLLLEVGKEPSNETDIPAFVAQFQFTEYNWNYTLEPQKNMALGMVDGRINYPRGRVLGGSSILNYMMHVRGNRLDYDGWKSLGNKGWSYDDVLPYFKKSEDYQVKLQDKQFHSKGGYLGVEDVSFRTESSYAFVNMMKQSNYPMVDYNGRQQYGVSHLHATTRDGRRSSSIRAFLDPIRSRKNLKIITEAHVVKIVVSCGKAKGVEVLIGRKRVTIKARNEVILSAGALNSPQILMLSGIGPRKHLKNLKIKIIKDLPVGQRLTDHLCYIGLTFLVNDTNFVLNPALFRKKYSRNKWKIKLTGPLASPGGVEALAFIKTNVSSDPNPLYPDVELIFIGLAMHSDKGAGWRHCFRITDDMYNKYWKPYEDKPAFSIIPLLFRPHSYGNVTLTSKNPFDYPKFYGNHFTDRSNIDLKTMIAGIRKTIDIVSKSPIMKKVNARLAKRPVPGCEAHEMSSDIYWECALRHLTATLHHQMGTCKMGKRNDPEAVVDERLRVHGINSLRVIDASIIPKPITAHTNIPTYMIAEKGSDMIKQDWKASG